MLTFDIACFSPALHTPRLITNTMAQLFDSVLTQEAARLLCCYINETPQIQVVRITDIPGWYFERVVFPSQRLIFESPFAAHLEIHTGMMASSILSDTIACQELAMEAMSQGLVLEPVA
jgi:hypothetical protein